MFGSVLPLARFVPYPLGMGRSIGVVLRWTGRALVVAAPLVLVCALFLPQAIEPLSPVICPDGFDLDNRRTSGAFEGDNNRLELVCTSPTASESAAQRVLLFCAIVLATGLAALYLSQRFTQQHMVMRSGARSA